MARGTLRGMVMNRLPFERGPLCDLLTRQRARALPVQAPVRCIELDEGNIDVRFDNLV